MGYPNRSEGLKWIATSGEAPHDARKLGDIVDHDIGARGLHLLTREGAPSHADGVHVCRSPLLHIVWGVADEDGI